ncbi:MAG: hypothetical protein HC824_04625 [Synechococcales cyanobacterium RM1_1_8]|nr:hypothetical protein [Synechococcales cyanobacterium RM1_1_8]
MVALGQLVAGIAHEINTPLGAICSSAEYISDYLHRDLPGLSKFFQDLSGSQRQLLEKVLTQQSDRCCLLSSRERRSRRRSLQQALETAAIPGARSLSEQLMAIQAQWNLEELLPLLREANGLAFLQGLGRLLELKHSSQDINIAAERASKVVFALKTYARYDHMGEPLQVNLEASLETILTLYQNKLKQGIEVHRSYEAIPEILGYPDELNQVWMNLIHNAIQAMGDAGNLGIVLRQGPGCARVSIADSGCGIPEAVQARMFEPFFTTKPPGEGSGLGLDIVKKIVEKHGGHIQVSSRPSYTIFTVVLPLAPQAAEAQEADEVQGEGQGEGQAGDGDTMDRLFSTMVLG